MNLRTYENIILQVGGNDVSAGKTPKDVDDHTSLIWTPHSCSNKDCNIIVSVPPPPNQGNDVNVYRANVILQKLCQHFGLVFIRQYEM